MTNREVNADPEGTAAMDAAGMIRRFAGPVTDEEAKRVEVADFGLSRLDREGAQILTLVATDRITVKIVVLFAGQTLPEHWHPRVGDDPGKEETIRVVGGALRCYIPGADTLRGGFVPEGKQNAYTARQEHLWTRAQITLAPGRSTGSRRARKASMYSSRPSPAISSTNSPTRRSRESRRLHSEEPTAE
jgi:D-lyxose ketol-isomerase